MRTTPPNVTDEQTARGYASVTAHVLARTFAGRRWRDEELAALRRVATCDLSTFPSRAPAEWDRDHRVFVLATLLPILDPPEHVARVIRWAYEDGAEERSNGSSVVPDTLYPFGRIKDPPGVAHDWLFELHARRVPDPSGHRWGLLEANLWYRDAVRAFGRPLLAAVRFFGLCVGSWVPWYFGAPPAIRPRTGAAWSVPRDPGEGVGV